MALIGGRHFIGTLHQGHDAHQGGARRQRVLHAHPALELGLGQLPHILDGRRVRVGLPVVEKDHGLVDADQQRVPVLLRNPVDVVMRYVVDETVLVQHFVDHLTRIAGGHDVGVEDIRVLFTNGLFDRFGGAEVVHRHLDLRMKRVERLHQLGDATRRRVDHDLAFGFRLGDDVVPVLCLVIGAELGRLQPSLHLGRWFGTGVGGGNEGKGRTGRP